MARQRLQKPLREHRNAVWKISLIVLLATVHRARAHREGAPAAFCRTAAGLLRRKERPPRPPIVRSKKP